ncbi:hypothetical protein CAPTEDRAFT_188536 [Capitella teleta]|uniref:Thioredoxin domain-containing protein n=1 Tax=Capitella teleta TaxID=283909 RepID=R7U6Y4_CAPTE|nr:hypothetical protein CAPTEDRAFT_188536 [Capitella teleta]|eukprot:ELT99421.1 hypothetical protein CAPTEDRAFT_188536 [Capitella teleta]
MRSLPLRRTSQAHGGRGDASTGLIHISQSAGSVFQPLLFQTQCKHRDLKFFIVHPHSPHVKILERQFRVVAHPSIIFLRQSDGKLDFLSRLSPAHVNEKRIETEILLLLSPAVRLNQDNFDGQVMTKSKYYVPLLVTFFVRTSPSSSDHLKAFDRMMQDFNSYQIRFGLYEINATTSHTLQEHVTAAYSSPPPFTVFFDLIWKKTTVTNIRQITIMNRPTFPEIETAFIENNVTLKREDGKVIECRNEWKTPVSSHVSSLYEGPHGSLCSLHASNRTDSYPVDRPKVMRRTVWKKVNATQGEEISNISTIEIEETLQFMTEVLWLNVIERSSIRTRLYNSNENEVRVTMVVFIIEGCGSCRKNLPLFKNLNKAVQSIDGAAFYLMNCSAEVNRCKQLGVSGFPTLSAFRSFPWIQSHQCMAQNSKEDRYMRVDFHGPLMEKRIMEWFKSAASSSVTSMGFTEPDLDEMELDVSLVATVLPKESPYLPRVAHHKREQFFPLECFRMSCELLSAQAKCFTVFSSDVPPSQFDDIDSLVVIKIEMFRSDGMQALIFQLGRSLLSTMQEEESLNEHRVHSPHSSLVFQADLPVLVTLVHQANISADSKFYKTLSSVAADLYHAMVVVTIDVDRYPAWAGQFVPRHRTLPSEGDLF